VNNNAVVSCASDKYSAALGSEIREAESTEPKGRSSVQGLPDLPTT